MRQNRRILILIFSLDEFETHSPDFDKYENLKKLVLIFK